MAANGRPPKPVERKRATGNPGKRALPAPTNVVALAPASRTPAPVRPLDNAGITLWERAWTAGRGWISPATDLELLQIVCEQTDERVALRLKVLREGDVDDRKALRELDKQLVSNLSLLGFTPTDRTRLGLAEVKATSKLEAMRASQAQRMAASVVNTNDAD